MLKKDSLLKGTIVLAAAALVARFLGLFQRVPLDYMLDSAGRAYFGLANNVYLFLLVIATAGIPSTISKMVSERYARGRIEEAQQIYRAALLFGAVTGLIISASLYLLAPFATANIAMKPGAELAVQAIAPALLLFPIIAMMRGYFQGRQMMTAGGISQIIEQVLRVITGVALAFIFLSWGYDNEWLAAGAAAGSVFGSIGAFAVMLWYARKLKRQDAAEKLKDAQAKKGAISGAVVKLKLRRIYGEIFRMSLPIVFTALTVQFLYLVDTFFFVRLTGSLYSATESMDILGWLVNRAQALAGIPPILAIALSQSIIPVISSAFAVRNMNEVQRQGSVVMRIVLFTGIPVSIALTVASISVTGFIFTDTGGSGIVAALTAGTVFQITMMTTNSVLFGLSNPKAPMRHTIAGMAVKLVASMILGPLLGVYGLIIASTLCFLLITVLNMRTIRGEVTLNVLSGRWLRYASVIAITAGVGFGLDAAGRTLLQPLPDKLMYFVTAALTGLVILTLYLVLLVALKVVTAEDAKSYPGPLRKLFGILLRRFPVRESR
ncbi:putative polysaccharide biosynthesis protein [Paenibacillus abyssi]|uniref:Stage V sporulation protein B n=1 Tax=Paenibacillus abyssi TaxID=1340531 RepID=A0A917CTZ7_9BACL|nr:polysaccharide biosynthesis protein [Paenibacillus abyssi]GGF96796.1 stage V sporulation protein B [Paenibacillus abyssi]